MGDVTLVFFFSSRGRQTISDRDWSPDVCSPDLVGARLHDAFTARERPGGELPREQRYVRGNEQENEGRGSPHPALEGDPGGGPRREHVGGDDDGVFPLVAHRRSPVSRITPSASATRRSTARAPSAFRSTT